MECGKKYIVSKVINSFIDSILPVLHIVVPGLIINELLGNRNVSTLTTYIAVLCIIPVINHIKELTLGVYINKLSKRIVRCFEVDLHIYCRYGVFFVGKPRNSSAKK